MSLYPYKYRALANGLQTDHPIPGLPFVDDSHIPVDDPMGIQSIGRHEGDGSWGREDSIRDAGWAAFTTELQRLDLAWCVRWHPRYGRSVVVYRDEDAASVHMTWLSAALLFRSGGYWWDGSTWYRPVQVYDAAREDYVHRPVPAASTVTAADLLNDDPDKDQARVLDIREVDPDAPLVDRWNSHLALWAAHRASNRPLDGAVVKFTAPELTGDQLIGVAELADIAGVAASTLRAYISRGEGDVPEPQATIGKRSVWARPVAEEWAEQRRRSHAAVAGSVSTSRPDKPVPPGISDVWEWFTRDFSERMSNPQWRKRWALRWRGDRAIRELAQTLASDVAGSLDRIVPTSEVAAAVRDAVLFGFSQQRRSEHAPGDGDYGINRDTVRLLDWLIRHDPSGAAYAIAGIIGGAERELGIARQQSEESIRTGLRLDSKLDRATLDDFLGRVFSPNPPHEWS